MAIDWEAFKSGKRRVKTRSGDSVRYGMRVNNKHFPHVVIVETDDGEIPRAFTERGTYYIGLETDYDLIQDEEVIEITTYANVYSNGYVYGGFLSYNDAKNSAHDGCLATVKFTTRIQGDKVTISGGTDGQAKR